MNQRRVSAAGNANSISHPQVKKIDPSDERFMPLSCLNTFAREWTIKAKVIKKYPMKYWKNERGEGNLFSVDLMDREDTQIQATMYKESADKWFEILQEGKIYTMSGGIVKMANKRYTTIPHDHQLTFNADSDIQEVHEDVSKGGSTIIGSGFNFTNFEQVK